jgi:two-component system sensor histidine kinase TctE
MIRSIVENALVHAPGPVKISLSQNGATITLGVHDRGAGLATDMKDRVFERFVRVDQSKPGSGLGLSIAKMVAEALGGQIELRDREGGGTSVLVTLPATTPEQRT